MATYLILNQNYVQNGLGTLTYIVPTTANYNVRVQATVPTGISTDQGAGSGRDLGLGVTGGFPGASVATEKTLGTGQTGLGTAFPNVPANSAPGVDPTTLAESTPNLPSVALGSGVLGLGFRGTNAGAPANAASASSVVTSGLVITVLDGATTLYTSPTITPTQGSFQFTYGFPATAADSITVVFTSSNANDKTLNAIVANVSIGQGL